MVQAYLKVHRMTISENLSRAELEVKAQAKIELQRRDAKRYGFKWFVNNVFCLSFPEFVRGQYIDTVCENMEANLQTMDVTARDHFKSTRNYAEIMFLIFTLDTAWEGWYFSYSDKMARYHLRKISRLIEANPSFKTLTNHKSTTEFLLEFSWGRYAPKKSIYPAGLLEFKRGVHAEGIYIDDPFKDVDEKKELDPAIIRKINEVVKSEVQPMIKKGGRCRIVGTPQTDEDFFFDKEMQLEYTTTISQAIVSRETKTAIWPEWMTYEQLASKERLLGSRRFSREYMARPIKSVNSYIPQTQYENAVRLKPWKLKDHNRFLHDKLVVAGFDIGKKRHPSHLAAFIKTFIPAVDEDGEELMIPKFSQIFNKWFDGVNYSLQIEYLNRFCDAFNVFRLSYDNTRSEFESYAEEGKLHSCMEPVVFTAKRKVMMATTMEQLFDTDRIILCEDEDENTDRQMKQFLSVNGNLDAQETPQGHGDSFWSIGLAVSEDEVIIQARSA